MGEIFCFFGEKEDFLPYAQPQICIYKKKMLTLHAENIYLSNSNLLWQHNNKQAPYTTL